MNRGLLLGLAAVAGLSIYLSMQSDDDLLAPTKGNARPGKPGDAGQQGEGRHERAASRSPGPAGSKVDPKDAWVGKALMGGVAQWQARIQSGDGSLWGRAGQQAWGSMSPPPAPAPKVESVAPSPPPPPMAPRFPHAWVGRFNDEPVAAASGASGLAVPLIARAVLTGPATTWVVKAGDVIEGQWRVDRIQDRTMSLTYLPLKQQQTVAMR